MEMTAAAIESALGKLTNLPTPVSGWEVKTGLDATDDPAVWVWVKLLNEHVDIGTRSQLRDMVRDRVRRKTGAPVWVYVRFRGASEAA